MAPPYLYLHLHPLPHPGGAKIYRRSGLSLTENSVQWYRLRVIPIGRAGTAAGVECITHGRRTVPDAMRMPGQDRGRPAGVLTAHLISRANTALVLRDIQPGFTWEEGFDDHGI